MFQLFLRFYVVEVPRTAEGVRVDVSTLLEILHCCPFLVLAVQEGGVSTLLEILRCRSNVYTSRTLN